MKVFLMHRDQDYDLQQPIPPNQAELTKDLELNTLFNAMALGDRFLLDVAKETILSGCMDIDTILYRQDILKDCLKNPSVVREIYQIPLDSIEKKRKSWLGIFTHNPSGVLMSAVNLMGMFVELLKRLKQIADAHSGEFTSEGFTRFFAMIQKELDDDYFVVVENHLKALKFKDGVLLSAVLGRGNEGADYCLRKPKDQGENWMKRVFAQRGPVYSFSIPPRDDHGARALADITERGINLVANALAQSADHIDSFFSVLRVELAFYMGCINLSEQIVQMENPISFPCPVPASERRHSMQGLYDVCLALTTKQKIVGNAVDADHKDLIIITGANQGGKSTFLRSIGLAQLMMQCGMFVPAEDFCANLCAGVFTHYKRKEDATMKSGKLDEELVRMSTIADSITPNSLMLFNESFAATNEREGSEIASQITRALLDKRIKVVFVTHQYAFAHGFYEKQMENAIFLRAERKSGGRRTYKLFEGEPMQTSYGEDIYHKVFVTEH